MFLFSGSLQWKIWSKWGRCLQLFSKSFRKKMYVVWKKKGGVYTEGEREKTMWENVKNNGKEYSIRILCELLSNFSVSLKPFNIETKKFAPLCWILLLDLNYNPSLRAESSFFGECWAWPAWSPLCEQPPSCVSSPELFLSILKSLFSTCNLLS